MKILLLFLQVFGALVGRPFLKFRLQLSTAKILKSVPPKLKDLNVYGKTTPKILIKKAKYNSYIDVNMITLIFLIQRHFAQFYLSFQNFNSFNFSEINKEIELNDLSLL